MANTSPQRLFAGMTQQPITRPMGHVGVPDPMFYHQQFSDFNSLDTTATTGDWILTANTNGTAALAAGDGGLVLLTTNSSTPLATDLVELQGVIADFTLTSGKRTAFVCRFKLSSITNNGFVAGLMATGTDPLVTPADALYFFKIKSSTVMKLRSVVGGVATDLTIPAGAMTAAGWADNTFIDVGFFIDRNGQVNAFVDSTLEGFVPQSGVGSTTPARGPVAQFSPTFTTANLAVTVALQSGTTTSKTATVDYVSCVKER